MNEIALQRIKKLAETTGFDEDYLLDTYNLCRNDPDPLESAAEIAMQVAEWEAETC